jgi:hypothetical protein
MPDVLRKRRHLRRFFLAACLIAPPAFGQQPIPAVQPVVDMVLANEAELVAGLALSDVERLQRLAWTNSVAAGELVKRDPPISEGDPVARALRAAHVACANAHSTIGMLAFSATEVLITNIGGDNTNVNNEAHRQSLDFFLKPYFEQRRRCADRSGIVLGETPLKARTADLLPAFSVVKTPRLTPQDRAELTSHFSGLSNAEIAAAGAVANDDVETFRRALITVKAFVRFLHIKDDPDMPRRDYAVFKECRWAAGHGQELLNNLHEAATRPDIRAQNIDAARKKLEEYRDSKRDCATALGISRDASRVSPALEVALAK